MNTWNGSPQRELTTNTLSGMLGADQPRAQEPPPRQRTERAYPRNLIHYNRLDRGGHFAAWEQPQLFSEEIRASFRPLRNRAR
jgi:pimeloyl-ACP methyl ester carboxylesterase